MKSIKVDLETCSYPLFIDFDLASRLGDLCNLYRLPKNRILLTHFKNDNFLSNLSGFKQLLFGSQGFNKEFKILNKIFNLLLLEDLGDGVTLVVFGEDWLINAAGFASCLLKFPIHLVCLPSSLWSMIETGINNMAFLNYESNASILHINYCPKLILLDAQFINSKNPDSQLLSIASILRHLLIAKSDIFHLFQSNLPEIISTNNSDNIQILEELILSRITLYQEKEARNCLNDFGLRFLNLHRAKSKVWPSAKTSALIIFIEICWRWKLSKELKFSRPIETDYIFTLIEKICVKHKIGSENWSKAKEIIVLLLSENQLENLYLPETIGKMKSVNSVDLNLAQKCIDEC